MTQHQKTSGPRLIRDTVIVVVIFTLIAVVIYQSQKGTGEKEKDLALRVIAQCWKDVAQNKVLANGALAQASNCRQMEYGYEQSFGSAY